MADTAVTPARARTLRETHTETRKSFRTTEFYAMIVFVAGILLATYLDEDSLARSDGWMFASLVVGAYIISRGLSKLGSGEPRVEEYEHNTLR